ncbi:MAG: DUF2007 domain-containing protein [Candidatus Omnitrophota bacterium]
MAKPGQYEPFKELLRTFNQADIVFIKSLLEDNDILYYINNENVDMVGLLSFAEPMRIMVAEDQLESAQELIAPFDGNLTKFSIKE